MKTVKLEVYKNKKDKGFLSYGANWWFNPSIRNSYSIFNIDCFYQKEYFQNDHIDSIVIKKYVKYILQYGRLLLNRKVQSILEFGCGSGWFTNQFIKKGLDIYAIEGSRLGYLKTRKRVGKKNYNRIIKHDLRLPFNLKRKFDLAVCTEVAEHIEPPFSSQLVATLTKHSNIIWFSFEKPLTNIQHYHHSNEQPEIFWKNLFQFYGYKMLKLPKKVSDDLKSRGGYIFYHKKLKIPSKKQFIKNSKETLITFNKVNNSIINNLKLNVVIFIIKISNKLERLAYKLL